MSLIKMFIIIALIFSVMFTMTIIVMYEVAVDYKEDLRRSIGNAVIAEIDIERLGMRDNIGDRERRDIDLSGISTTDIEKYLKHKSNLTIQTFRTYNKSDLPVTIGTDTYNYAGVYVEVDYLIELPISVIPSIRGRHSKYYRTNTFLSDILQE